MGRRRDRASEANGPHPGRPGPRHGVTPLRLPEHHTAVGQETNLRAPARPGGLQRDPPADAGGPQLPSTTSFNPRSIISQLPLARSASCSLAFLSWLRETSVLSPFFSSSYSSVW